MDDVEAAKGSPKKETTAGIDVAIIYNVDFEEARTEADPCFESRSTVESVAEEVASALASDGVSQRDAGSTEGDFAELRSRLEAISADVRLQHVRVARKRRAPRDRVPTVLELMGIPYTGSPPEALCAALYKDRVKQRLVQAGVPTPGGSASKEATGPATCRSPLIVKPAREDGSAGIWGTLGGARRDHAARASRRSHHMFKAPCLVEAVHRGERVQRRPARLPAGADPPTPRDRLLEPPTRPPHRLVRCQVAHRFGRRPRHPAGDAPRAAPAIAARLRRAATEACRAVGVRDYGRVDIRLSNTGIPYVIDVNPNCDLSADAGYARAAHSVGIDYPALTRLLVRYALRRRKGVGNAREPRAASSGEAR